MLAPTVVESEEDEEEAISSAVHLLISIRLCWLEVTLSNLMSERCHRWLSHLEQLHQKAYDCFSFRLLCSVLISVSTQWMKLWRTRCWLTQWRLEIEVRDAQLGLFVRLRERRRCDVPHFQKSRGCPTRSRSHWRRLVVVAAAETWWMQSNLGCKSGWSEMPQGRLPSLSLSLRYLHCRVNQSMMSLMSKGPFDMNCYALPMISKELHRIRHKISNRVSPSNVVPHSFVASVASTRSWIISLMCHQDCEPDSSSASSSFILLPINDSLFDTKLISLFLSSVFLCTSPSLSSAVFSVR